MTASAPVHMGVIQLANAEKRYGMILDDDEKTRVFFSFDAVEVGYPAPGEAVQFVPDTTRAGMIARRIIVVSAVARGKWERGV
jgi:cold shock CspA family protein